MEVRKSVQLLSERMEKKLRRDDNCKPAWETENRHLKDLVFDLMGEVVELAEAIDQFILRPDDITADQLADEAADVANEAMIIASRVLPEMNMLRRGRHPEWV